jgi:hypothetical protein
MHKLKFNEGRRKKSEVRGEKEGRKKEEGGRKEEEFLVTNL